MKQRIISRNLKRTLCLVATVIIAACIAISCYCPVMAGGKKAVFSSLRPVIRVAQENQYLTGNFTLTVSWDQIADADGYILYRRIGEEGAFTRIKKYKKNDLTVYQDTDIVRGNNYTYRMRAYYLKANGEKIYTKRSAITSVVKPLSEEILYTQKKVSKRLAALISDLSGCSFQNSELMTSYRATGCLGAAKYIYYQLFGYNDTYTYSTDGINYTLEGGSFAPVFVQGIPETITTEEIRLLFENAATEGTLTPGAWLQYSYINNSGYTSQHSAIFVDFTEEKDGIIIFDGNYISSVLDNGVKNHCALTMHTYTYEYLANLLNTGVGNSYQRGIAVYQLADLTAGS